MLPSKILFKSLIVVCLVVVFGALGIFTPVRAELSTSSSSAEASGSVDFVSKTENNFLALFHITSCVLTGEPIFANGCFGSTGRGVGLLQFVEGGISTIVNTKPLSTQAYLADVGKNLGVVKEVNAQVGGSGSNVVSVIYVFWVAARNIAYLVITIILVIMGIMIMYRHKLNPQTVVTIQNSLPGIVVALAMITFSYFLASLIVDMAFVGTQMVGYTFQSILKVSNADIQTILQTNNLFSLYTSFVGTVTPGDYAGVITPIVRDPYVEPIAKTAAGIVTSNYALQITGTTASIPVIGWITGLAGAAAVAGAVLSPETFVAMAVSIIMTLALLYAMVKVFITLIGKYLSILFLTISAPLQFMLAPIPGNQGSIRGWAVNMIADVLAFPAIVGAFYFAAYFVLATGKPFEIIASTGIVNNGSLPLLGVLDFNFLRKILGLGVLLAAPAIPEWITKTLKASVNDTFGKEVGNRFSESQKRITGFVGQVGGLFKSK